MPTLTLGEGPDAKSVTVSDEFTKLSPAEQQATANDIARQIGVVPQAKDTEDAPGERWRQSSFLPIEMKDKANVEAGKWESTGDWRVNIGGFIDNLLDPVRLPGEVMRGEVDPMSEEGFERAMGTAMFGIGAGGVRGGGIAGAPGQVSILGKEVRAGKPKVAGEVVSETAETLGGKPVDLPVKETTGTATPSAKTMEAFPLTKAGQKAKEKAIEAEKEKATAANKETVATTTDDELSTLFAKGDFNYKQATRTFPGGKVTAPGYENVTGTAAARVNKPARVVREGMKVVGKEGTGEASYSGGMGTEVFKIFRQFKPAKQRELQVKQTERVQAAAKGEDVNTFLTELQKSRVLDGRVKELPDEAKDALAASKEAVKVLDDPVKVEKFVRELDEAEGKVAKASDKAKKKPGWMDMIFEGWVNSLLSSVQTHAVNITSNELVNLWGHAENYLATGIGKVLPGKGMTLKEANARLVGDLESVGEALYAAGKSFKTEKDLFEANILHAAEGDIAIGTGALESRAHLKSIPGRVGGLIRVPGRALTAEDAFFKTMAYRQEIAGLAMRQAIEDAGSSPSRIAQRFHELKANPTTEMKDAARTAAKYKTFSSELGTLGRATQIALQHSAWKFILPFFRTPANLLRYSAERTPAAILLKKSRDELLGRQGVHARNQAITRVAMGTSIGAYVFHEAMKGNVSGFGPSSPAERAVWRAAGNQPYSIKLGDTWYSYSRLEPLGTILGIAADAQSVASEASEMELSDIAALTVASISNNVQNKTWLRGPVEFAEAVSDPTRYASNYARRMVGTIIPTALAQYARTEDPYLREVNSILDAIKERLHGYRETLAVQRGVFGEPLRSQGGLGPDLITPFYTTAAKKDVTINEMLRLKEFPGRLEKNVSGVELTPEEWDYYSGVTGQTIKKLADAVVKSPVYEKLTDGLKKMLLDETIRKAHDIGRTTLKLKFPDLQMRIAQKKAMDRLMLVKPSAANPPAPPLVPEQSGQLQ